jgi:hypothetical protein
MTQRMMTMAAGRGAVTPWWLEGGIDPATAVAVYQPIGAASLAASYVNLANPGVNDAAPGVAPTFDAATGWGFNGDDQVLTTGVVPTNDQTWTAIARFSGGETAGNNRYLLAMRHTETRQFGLASSTSLGGVGYANGGIATVSPALASGVLAVAGAAGYRNGAINATGITTWTGDASNPIVIGARSTGTLTQFFYIGNIQAVAIYNATLTAPQVAAVSAAMAAL